MAAFLDTSDHRFEAAFNEFLELDRAAISQVDEEVAAIVDAVRTRGDAALLEYTATLDRLNLDADGLAFRESEIRSEISDIPPEQREALELAAGRIENFHRRQMPDDARWTDSAGAELGWRWTPVERVGLYVPGGSAAYPSTVLMNGIPARVAGVDELVMTVPTPRGAVSPLVLLAAKLCGVGRIYRIGGAQAIAALAFGTETVRPVDKITGPGNSYVAAAKRQVYGRVGIDLIAGPSEILVIADGDNEPEWMARDLLSQAEHDCDARAVLITTDREFGKAVAGAVEKQLSCLARERTAARSWERFGAVIVAKNLDEAAALSDRIAPEHLALAVSDPDGLSRKIRHAGAIFLGSWTPEAIGDYVAGPNHVLPTSRTARFSSGLSVLDFLKRTTISRMTPAALAAVGPAAVTLANAESLQAHALSVQARLARINADANA